MKEVPVFSNIIKKDDTCISRIENEAFPNTLTIFYMETGNFTLKEISWKHDLNSDFVFGKTTKEGLGNEDAMESRL